jgi:hypothetical protein
MLNISVKPNIHNSFDHDVTITALNKNLTYFSLSLIEIDSLIVKLYSLAGDLTSYRYHQEKRNEA